MKKALKIVGIVLAVFLIMGAGVAIIDNQNQQKQLELDAQKAQINKEQQALQQQATQQAENKANLNACIGAVNETTNDALGTPTLKNATPESAASYTQNIMQLQQTQIEECKARNSQ